MSEEKKDKKEKGDDEEGKPKGKSNLVPAIIIAVGLVLGGKMMGGGGAAPAAATSASSAARRASSSSSRPCSPGERSPSAMASTRPARLRRTVSNSRRLGARPPFASAELGHELRHQLGPHQTAAQGVQHLRLHPVAADARGWRRVLRRALPGRPGSRARPRRKACRSRRRRLCRSAGARAAAAPRSGAGSARWPRRVPPPPAARRGAPGPGAKGPHRRCTAPGPLAPAPRPRRWPGRGGGLSPGP